MELVRLCGRRANETGWILCGVDKGKLRFGTRRSTAIRGDRGRATMKIGSLVSTAVVSVGPTHTLAHAAQRMAERHVGSALVLVEEGHPGIITERDLLRAIAEGADASSAMVEQYMTAVAITASRSWEVTEAARLMSEGRFRHLIVLDDQGVMGVLSMRDLVGALLEELDSRAGPRGAGS